MRNSLQKMAALLFCVSAVMADVSSLSKGYLPPDQGYNYDSPSVPFPSPAPSYRPPAATITPRPPPNYQTVAPAYQTQPPYRPSYTTPKPTYGGGSGYAEEGSQISPVSNPGAGLGGGEFDHLQQPHVPGMPFDFNYAVKDDYYGTDYGHQATSNGDQVRGEYRVQLPDGRLQIVKYIADWKDGYTAEVSYQGEAQYPPVPPSSGGSIGSGSGYPSPIGKPQPSPGYPQPGYPQPSPGYPSFPSSGPTFQPQPSPAYPSPSPAYPSPSPAYPVQTVTYQPPKPISSYPKPGSGGSSFGGSQQVPVSTGYPSGIPSSGYPSGLPGGYPSGIPSSGYPSSSPTAGYPVSSKPSSGYGQPSNFAPQNSYGPSQGSISGFGSSQQPTSGYSSPAPSYSSGPDYGGY